MNLFRNMGPFMRKLSIILLILVLLGFTLFLYYFKYVPSNRSWLQRQGFSILQQQSRGINQGMDDRANFICNNPNDSLRRLKPCIGKISINARGDSLVLRDSLKGTIQHWTFKEVFDQVLRADKDEFFQAYFITCQGHHNSVDSNGQRPDEKPHIIYHSADLPVSNNIQNDSVGALLSKVQFSKIVDVQISGNDYKAFLHPFQLGDQNSLILVGLNDLSYYRDNLQRVPFSVLNIIVMLFLVILIALPYLKIFLISPMENFSLRDIVLLGFSLFVGSALLAVMLQQVMMQSGGQVRSWEQLQYLNESVHERMTGEIKQAASDLQLLDSLLAKSMENAPSENTSPGNVTITSRDKSFRILPVENSAFYLKYYTVFWTDSEGTQLHKQRWDGSFMNFVNVNERRYFNDVITGRLHVLNGRDSIAIEPVYSKTTGEFELVIAKPSRVPGSVMVGMTVNMSSVIHTIVPKGFGFYVIDDEGRILFQSEGRVSLQENFFQWLNHGEDLASTLKSRQTQFVPRQFVKNKPYNLYLKPVTNLDWHLITFQCNSYATASILHISAFILFFLLLLFSMLFLFCLVAWNNTNYTSRLHQPIYQFEWFKPGVEKTDFLISANSFLLIYIFFTIIFTWISFGRAVILFNGFLFPLFTVYGLYSLFRIKVMLKKRSKDAPLNAGVLNQYFEGGHTILFLVLLLLINLVFFTFSNDPESARRLIVYQLLSLVFIAVFVIGADEKIIALFSRHSPKVPFKRLRKVVQFRPGLDHRYCSFWFLCVIAIAIVPTHYFYQYAQKREMALMVRTHQLNTAQKMEGRLGEVKWIDRVVGLRPGRELDSLMFVEGVYDIQASDKYSLHYEQKLPPEKRTRTEIYDSIIRHLSWSYNSFDKDLPYQGSAADMQWWRNDFSRKCPDSLLLAYNLRPQLSKPMVMTNVRSIVFSSKLPRIAEHNRLSSFKSKFLICLFSVLLLELFYKLLVSIARRLFMSNGASEDSHSMAGKTRIVEELEDPTMQLASQFGRVLKRNLRDDKEIPASIEEVWRSEYKYSRVDRRGIAELEDRILFNQHHLSELYKRLWKACSRKERYFLYDMAEDGFINYKNTGVINDLYYKGILVNNPNNSEPRIMSVSFRNYILEKAGSEEVATLKSQFHVQGSWSKIKTPALVSIAAIGTFFFITQQDLIQRVVALVPTLSAMLSLSTVLFGSSGKAATTK